VRSTPFMAAIAPMSKLATRRILAPIMPAFYNRPKAVDESSTHRRPLLDLSHRHLVVKSLQGRAGEE